MVWSPSISVKKHALGPKPLGGIHILEDAAVYRQYAFHDLLHRVNGMCHTRSIQIEYFIDSLDSFLWTYAPQREYSIMVGTVMPTIMMKAFVEPPIMTPFCALIVLYRLSFVLLEWLGVSVITVGVEADS